MAWHVFMSWRTFWHYQLFDKLFSIMTYFWLYDTLFDIMTYFLLHDKLVTSKQTVWRHGVFYAMTHFVTSWRPWWRHDKLFDIMTSFLRHAKLFEVMSNFWSNDETFDIMTNFLTAWRTFWHHDVMLQTIWRHDVCCTYWRHSDHFDARNFCLQYDAFCWYPDTLFDLMTNFFTRIFNYFGFLML